MAFSFIPLNSFKFMNNYLVLLYYNLNGELYAVGYFFPFDTKDSISPEVACAMKRYISVLLAVFVFVLGMQYTVSANQIV